MHSMRTTWKRVNSPSVYLFVLLRATPIFLLSIGYTLPSLCPVFGHSFSPARTHYQICIECHFNGKSHLRCVCQFLPSLCTSLGAIYPIIYENCNLRVFIFMVCAMSLRYFLGSLHAVLSKRFELQMLLYAVLSCRTEKLLHIPCKRSVILFA